MPKVFFQPSGQSVEVIAGTSLLDATRMAGVEMDAPCGGDGSCGQCIVRIDSGHYETDSLGILPESAAKKGYVLACRTQVLDSAVTVEVPELIGRIGGKFVEDEDVDWQIHADLLTDQRPGEPLVEKIQYTVPQPQLEDGLSDLDRLTRCIEKDGERRELNCPVSVLRSLAEALRGEDGNVTVTLCRTTTSDYVIDVEPGDCTARHFGLAVDVGTTTVAVQLVSLSSAGVLATRTDYNAQISCGLDVISRINYARTPDRREELRIRVLSTINNLIRKVAGNHDVKSDEIRAAVIAGNTTMMHLLLGLNPEYIRLEPYTPTVHEVPLLSAEEVGIHIHPRSRILICPSVGSYVGGDITAGLLIANSVDERESLSLFMDIGTNGELVIGNHDFLITCACSAGPAFEGGGIEHGMRAALGAIEQADIDPATGVATVRTIGGGKPVGICGSGMISLLAGLYRTGWIDRAGKFSRTRSSSVIRINGRRAHYVVVPEDESGAGKAIIVTELDIENVIRAKAAIYSAISMLLQHVGVGMERIGTVFIAGGFGRFLDLEQAITIGLIPDIPREKYRYVGNSSLMGASGALISRRYRERMLELSRRMTYVELNTSPEYMHQYTGALFLPHTDMDLFPSVRAATSQGKEC